LQLKEEPNDILLNRDSKYLPKEPDLISFLEANQPKECEIKDVRNKFAVKRLEYFVQKCIAHRRSSLPI
jgi:hypothetical protein